MSALKAVPASSLPSAWYNLSVRISEARAVASCALESLPCSLNGAQYDRINTSGHLISAVQDILALMAKDAEQLEHHFNA